ncbi:Sodium-dependent dicarboxylate transporter SdcS [bioreactor metagenome]|uniref:Sodium-dependent dicarboxylate transporter SdcS n=1 Tax=bioreactor metagenome TaxID=1076179 RepID=A0A645ARH4_9ZZZZ
MLMIGMTFSIAIASGMTPIAHVFSIMAMGFYQTATNLTINYFQYMVFAIPVGLLTFTAMMLLFRFVLKPNVAVFNRNQSLLLKNDLGKMDKREIADLLIFIAIIALWIAPGLLTGILPAVASYIDAFGTAMPPLLGAVLLMIITVDGKPLLSFNEAMTKGVSWGALIMTASTLAIGSALTNSDIGITAWLTAAVGPHLQSLSPLLLVFVFTLWAAIQTNLSSNMVTVTVVCAIALPIVIATGGSVNAPAIASIIGLMASFSFATPPAHPNVALAGSSGWTDTKQLLFYGSMTMFIAVLITVFIGYPLACLLMI